MRIQQVEVPENIQAETRSGGKMLVRLDSSLEEKSGWSQTPRSHHKGRPAEITRDGRARGGNCRSNGDKDFVGLDLRNFMES